MRRAIGYQRYESQATHQLLGEIYEELHLYTNMFRLTFKLKSKKRTGAKVHKEHDTPQTSLQRISDTKLRLTIRVYGKSLAGMSIRPNYAVELTEKCGNW